MENDSTLEAIRQFVVGEASWKRLRLHGIRIAIEGDSLIVENPRHAMFRATPKEIATGFIRSLESGTIKEWATVLVGASLIIDFVEMDNPEGDEIINGLWDAAFGDPLLERRLRVIREVASRDE